MTSVAAAALVPLSIATSPNALSMPVDLALAVALPIHSHIALNYVVSDYAQKISKHPACAGSMRLAVMGMTAVSILGLTKLTLNGKGVTGTLKELWRPKAV
eukprot:CAMPEP_0198209976 /NCGR_PEP_ID=MMETSP1445-20131203/18020_1 /TAXON_ID=36898 /ORGANISM="Pyramimonas sp., Strain CCMP2087" /LENGTH=100 /DNA_ID=CAMNT_0043883901 /DNA_START=126 /DNA_END=428 /DNA_ORIENTATION=+